MDLFLPGNGIRLPEYTDPPDLTHPSLRDLDGWWMLNEPAGLTARDISNAGNHGVSGVQLTPLVNEWGRARTFDGSIDDIDVGSNIDLVNSSFTVTSWARRNSTGTWDFIFAQGTEAVNSGLEIGFRTTNVFTFAFWGNDLNTPTYTDTNPHHWACTYDATTKSRSIYRDGIWVAGDTSPSNYIGSGAAAIGRVPFGSIATTSYFDGDLADVRVYKRALSEAEVARIASRVDIPEIFRTPDIYSMISAGGGVTIPVLFRGMNGGLNRMKGGFING